MYDILFDKKIQNPTDIDLNQITILSNELKSSFADHNMIIKQTVDILVNKFKSWSVFMIWVKAYAYKGSYLLIEHILLELEALMQFLSLDEIQLNKLDYCLNKAISDLSLITSVEFSFNNYQLAELVNENAKTQPNPEQFIAKELPTNKTLAFFKHKIETENDNAKFISQMIDKINELKLELTETLSTLKKIFNIYQTLCTTDKPTNITTEQSVMEKIDHRKQAYQLLRTIADFLIKNEPHAFTGYILNKLASLEDSNLAQSLKNFPQLDGLIKSL